MANLILRRRARQRERAPEAAEPADRPSNHRPAYDGGLQGVGNGNVLGWCWEPTTPEDRVQIAIAVDGEIVAEGRADVGRPDLADCGDGAHGFLISLPDSLRSPGRRRVVALAGPERRPIAPSPSFWHKAGSGSGWGDVVFEPEETLSGGALPARVPPPPVQPESRAVVFAGWLFHAREFGPAIDEPSSADLEAIVSSLRATGAACAALGIEYLPVILPAKRNLLDAAPASDRGWLDALAALLRDVDEVQLLDLLPVLRHAARHGATYQRTDCDWNDRGAFFAARALLKEAHVRTPSLLPPALGDLHLCNVPAYRGTLTDAPKLELVGDDLRPCELGVEAEEGVVVDANMLRALRSPVEPHLAGAGSTHVRIYENPALPRDARLAVVGDRASLPLVRWLAERARRTTFFWSDTLPLTQLELELPTLVYHLMREGDLRGCSSAGRALVSEVDPPAPSPNPPA